VNGAFGRLLGHDPTTVVGASLSDFAAGGHEDVLSQALGDALRLGAASVEVPLRHARLQSPVPLRLELVDLTADPVVGSVVVTGQDVSDLHQARLRLEHLASHDSLTGLPNRSVLDALLGDLVPTGRPLAVLFVDLDGFKAVNDTFGHGAGDELLCHVAGRLAGGVAEGDLVARVGGDEFVVVSIDVAGRHQAQELALRLERLLDGPYRLRDGVASIGASVGVVCSNPGSSARDLLAAADRAMYDAKARRWGRGI
jgi:diguanylate cyclase (GGDEF)-like protein